MKGLLKTFSILLILLMLTLIVQPVLAFDAELAPEDVAEHAPRNQTLAVIFIIAAFAVKSLIVIIPIPVLYLASGLIFKPFAAFVINFAGMLVCTTVPYLIGRYAGAGFYQRIIKRYPKMQVLDTFQHENQWFVSFIVRAIGFLPCDAVSLVLGIWKVSFPKYLSGTALGMLPGLAATTLLGINISESGSPGFIISIILTLLVSAGSFILWRIYQKARRPHVPESLLSAGLDFQHKQDENSHVDYESNEYN